LGTYRPFESAVSHAETECPTLLQLDGGIRTDDLPTISPGDGNLRSPRNKKGNAKAQVTDN